MLTGSWLQTLANSRYSLSSNRTVIFPVPFPWHYFRLGCFLFILGLSTTRISAQESPQLISVLPLAGQRDTEIVIRLSGKFLRDATQILTSSEQIVATIEKVKRNPTVSFSGQGLVAEIPNQDELTVNLLIDANSPVGTHTLRVVTPSGVSNALQFIVSDLPEFTEIEPNPEIDSANSISLPATINGIIEAPGDVDSFKFWAKKDQHLIFDLSAISIGSKLDSILTIYSEKGEVLGQNDTSASLDANIEFKIVADGNYVLQVKDLRYRGGKQFFYRLSIGELPRVDAIFPLGGKAGSENTIALTGRNLKGVNSMQLSISPSAPIGIQQFRVTTSDDLSSNEFPFSINAYNEILETEPNNVSATSNSLLPSQIVNGLIDPAQDLDYYKIEVKSKERLLIELTADRLNSQLDAVVQIFGPKGDLVIDNDDTIGPDAVIDHTFSTSGEYVIEIRDINGRGGKTYGYRLQARPLTPDFLVSVDTDTLRVNRRSCTILPVSLMRIDGFDQAVQLSVLNLPPGITASKIIIEPSQNRALLSLSADKTAELNWTTVILSATSNLAGDRMVRKSGPIYLTVIDTAPFRLTLAELSVNLLQTKSANLHLKLERQSNFTGPVKLSVIGLPTNVISSDPTITSGHNQAVISLRGINFVARELFPVVPAKGRYTISVSGSTTIDNQPVTQSSTVIVLAIDEAPFTLTATPVIQSFVLPIKDESQPEQIEGLEEVEQITTQTEPVGTAIIEISATRQGNFTGTIDLSPVNFPDGLSVSNVDIQDQEDKASLTFSAYSQLETKTYKVKISGHAMVNGQPFIQESPEITIKIIR